MLDGKSDGYGILYFDHFINSFNVSTIQSLVKNKRKSMNDSGDYRAITLVSPLSNFFDWIILN